MTNFSKIALSAMIVTAGAFTSCNKNDAPAAKPSIYARLGGTAKVADPDNAGQMIESGRLAFRTVVNKAIGKIVADIGQTPSVQGNLGAHFQPIVAEVTAGNTANVAVLSKNLTDFFAANTGGGSTNTYTGLSMTAAHNPSANIRMGAKSTNADYTKFEGYVGASANEAGVASNTVLYADIVAVLESLRGQIVQ